MTVMDLLKEAQTRTHRDHLRLSSMHCYKGDKKMGRRTHNSHKRLLVSFVAGKKGQGLDP